MITKILWGPVCRFCPSLVLLLTCCVGAAAAEAPAVRVRAMENVNSFVVAPGTTEQLTAFVQRTDGTPLPGITLQFTAPPQGASGTFPASTEPGQRVIKVESDSQGTVTATFVTDQIPGVFLVGVSVEGSAAQTTFAFTNLPAPPDAAMAPTALKAGVQQWLEAAGETIGRSVLVQGPVLLPAGTVVTPAWPETPSARVFPLVIEQPSWLVWIDDIPSALFGHPVRFVVIDAAQAGPDVMRDAVIRAAHSWPLVRLPGNARVHSLAIPVEEGIAVPNGVFAPLTTTAAPALSYRAAAPAGACALLVYGPGATPGPADIIKHAKFLRDKGLVASDRIFTNAVRHGDTQRLVPVSTQRLKELIQHVVDKNCTKLYFTFITHGIPPEAGGGLVVASDVSPGTKAKLRPEEYAHLFDPLARRNVKLCIMQISCYAGWVKRWMQGLGIQGTVLTASNEHELAYYHGGTGSYFMDAMLRAMGAAAADSDHDGKVSAQEALDYANAHEPAHTYRYPDSGISIDHYQTADPQSDTISPVAQRAMTVPFVYMPSPGLKIVYISRPRSANPTSSFSARVFNSNERVASVAGSMPNMNVFISFPQYPFGRAVKIIGKDCGVSLYRLRAEIDGQVYEGENWIQVGHFRPDPRRMNLIVGAERTVSLELYGGLMGAKGPRDSQSAQFVISSRDNNVAVPDENPVDVPVRAPRVTFQVKGLNPGLTKLDIRLLRTGSVKTIEVGVVHTERTYLDACAKFERDVLWKVLQGFNPFGHPISLAPEFEGTVQSNGSLEFNGVPPEFVPMMGNFNCQTGKLEASGSSGSTPIVGFTNVPGKAVGTLIPNTAGQGEGSQSFARRRAGDNGATIEMTYTLGDGVFPGGPISWKLRGAVAGSGSCDFALDPSISSPSATGGSGTVFINTDAGCAWNATSDAAWLTLDEPASGSGPAAVGFQVAANTGEASRTGSITIGGVPVAITQDGTASTRPVIFSAGVVNGASFAAGITSGSWISILGSNFSPTARLWGDADFNGANLPTALDGVSVTINGRPAYIFYIGPGQLNVLAPDDEATGAIKLVVTTPNGSSDPYEVYKLPLDPALFLFDPENRRYAAAVHADGSLVAKDELLPGAATSPAKPGETILLFGTGFGLTDPPVPSAQLVAQPARLARPIVVRIGGKIAEQQFAGVVGSGLNQFNVVIPDLKPGDYLVEIFIDGVPIQQGVYVTVGE